jgi:chromosome segregation ATPase
MRVFSSLVAFLWMLNAAVPAQAPAATGAGVLTQLAQAARSYQDKVTGALREMVSYERQLADLAAKGSASKATINGALRNSLAARQRYHLALTQLIQAQGNPSGIAGAISGAGREIESYEQRLISMNSATDAAQWERTVQSRNNAQIKFDNQLGRWDAMINAALPTDLRSRRQGLTTSMEGALRELESLDRQMMSAGGGNNAQITSLQSRIKALEAQLEKDEQELQRIKHQGNTKAAQNPNTLRLERQIATSQQSLTNLKNQLIKLQQQQNQTALRQQAYIMNNRVNALDRFRLGLTQLLQFDAKLTN